MEPPHERAAGYLQMTWTPTDQVIMEHLLLEGQPTPKDKPPSPSSPEIWPRQAVQVSPSSSDTDAEKSATAGDKPSPPKKEKNDEDRRARHRAVQRRFVQRKKVLSSGSISLHVDPFGRNYSRGGRVGGVPESQAPAPGA